MNTTIHQQPIISVKNLVKRYSKADKNAVDDISFYVVPGTFFSLLGPNGAGKTTTISILTTILSKSDGQVTLAGHDLDSGAKDIRQEIGVIFQNPSLDLNLTAEENIRFHANLYNLYPYRISFKLMPKSYRDKVMELATVLDIQNDIHKPVKSYSGGMKRKLEIIRSLIHQPKVLFLDEPTTGLDPISRQNLWQYLQDIRQKEQITVFLTTHYLEEAEASDYICIMNHGQIVAKGTPTEIKNQLLDTYVEVDAKSRPKLETELTKLKLPVVGSGPFKIDIAKNRPAQKIIQQIQTPLTHLEIHDPSLEDAYIEIVNHNHA